MRKAIVTAIAFLILGFVLQLTLAAPADPSKLLSLGAWYVSFALLLLSPAILLAVFLLSLLPGAGRRFDQCNH